VYANRLQLAESEARVQQLQEQLAVAQEQAQQLEARGSVLAAERDAATRNLLRAETELNDVGEYSTKMFRQVSKEGLLRQPTFCVAGVERRVMSVVISAARLSARQQLSSNFRITKNALHMLAGAAG
jgi:chromosome segregation ATPase